MSPSPLGLSLPPIANWPWLQGPFIELSGDSGDKEGA
jgi:hypothetical protein